MWHAEMALQVLRPSLQEHSQVKPQPAFCFSLDLLLFGVKSKILARRPAETLGLKIEHQL